MFQSRKERQNVMERCLPAHEKDCPSRVSWVKGVFFYLKEIPRSEAPSPPEEERVSRDRRAWVSTRKLVR